MERMVSFLISVILSSSAAQPPFSGMLGQLTGSTSKVWTEIAIDRTLGRSDGCTEGREYEFTVELTGVLRECQDQRIVETRFSWSHRSDGIDDYIFLKDVEYRLIISTRSDSQTGVEYEEAVLRIETARPEPTTDIVLQHIP